MREAKTKTDFEFADVSWVEDEGFFGVIQEEIRGREREKVKKMK